MTIQAISPFYFPHYRIQSGSWGTAPSTAMSAAATLDAANEACGLIFTAPASGSLTAIAIRTQTVSVTSGPLNFAVRLESVSNGRPSGSLQAANTSATWSVATTDDNIWKENTLTAAATVVAGDFLAIVVKAPASGTFSFTWGGTSFPVGQPGMVPAFMADVNATPDGTYEAVIAVMPAVSVKIAGTWYPIAPFVPMDTIVMTTFNSGSANDEFAQRILLPISVRVIGAAVAIADLAAGADFTVSLWPDSAGSQTDADALAQKAIDGDTVAQTTGDGFCVINFASAVTLAANTVYWLGVRGDTANNMVKYSWTCSATISGLMAAFPGGAEFYQGARSWSAGSAAAFTPNTLAQQLNALRIDGIDSGSAAGLGAIGGAG